MIWLLIHRPLGIWRILPAYLSWAFALEVEAMGQGPNFKLVIHVICKGFG